MVDMYINAMIQSRYFVCLYEICGLSTKTGVLMTYTLYKGRKIILPMKSSCT